ncbi:MAG: antibiotic biosynthesis monooxygenase [Spirochaetes bacterium]|nr:antibiotic biosynthesis monooxygenase [Spirochaetota bacterium]
MIVIFIRIRVTPGAEDRFVAASLDNARHSIGEPGIARFDLVREVEDATRFVLVEAYRDEAAVAAHKETAHYARWKSAVEPLMAEPRTRMVYDGIFVPETGN